MAKYRAIWQKIWKDPDFQKYSPQGKLLFIYLCTCESTTESGIYPITIKTASDETGLSVQIITNLFKSLKNVLYDYQNCFVFLKKFRVYNAGGKPELIAKSVVNDFLSSIHTPLWSEFIKLYPQFRDDILSVGHLSDIPLLTVIQPLDNSSPSINQSQIIENTQPLLNGLETVFDGCGKIRSKGNPNGIVNGNPNTIGIVEESLSAPTLKGKLSNNLVFRKMQEHLGYPEKIEIQPIPNIGKELGFLKNMHNRGISDDDIIECWKQKVAIKKGSFVSLQWIDADIFNWITQGRKFLDYKNNGQKPQKIGVEDESVALEKYEWPSEES